jgi:TolA-binding protein
MAEKCNQIQRWMDDYRQGILPPERAGALESHLAECPLCQGVFEEQERLAALLRGAPPLPLASPAHLALLNRRVLERISARRGLRGLLDRFAAAVATLWYHPFTERSLALAGAVGILILGLWLGSTVLAPQRHGRNQIVAAPGAPSSRPLASLSAAEARAAFSSRDTAPGFRARDAQPNPFPTVYVIPQERDVTPSPTGSWVTLASLPPNLLDADRDLASALVTLDHPSAGRAGSASRAALSDSLAETPLAPSSAADSVLAAAAERIINEDFLGRLRRFKFDLYQSGATAHIPDVQQIEDLFYQILSSQANLMSEAGAVDVATQRRFSEAEGYMLKRDFRRAEDMFNDIAHEHSGTRVATLSWYHLGNIYYEFHGDFAGARQCYARSLEGTPSDVFPPEVLDRVRHRMALLDDAAGADYQPLRLLRQAEAAPAESLLDNYRHLLLDFPASAAAADGINSLAERAIPQVPNEPNLPVEAIGLLRQYQGLSEATHRSLAQLRLADIVYFGLRDLPQALIEYGQVEVRPEDREIEAMVRDRIALILDNRIAQ